MKLTVSFPINNEVHVRNPFPVTVGSKSYFIKTEAEVAKEVSVIWTSLSTDVGHKFSAQEHGPVKFNISTSQSDQYVLAAEHDIRAWQSLLSAYVLLDIDFDSPALIYHAETDQERASITIHSFATRRQKPRLRGQETFEVFGRAFLAIEEGKPHIEIMAHYRDARIALEAGRSIDAYNNFYLYLESQFCGGKSTTREAVSELMKHQVFTSSLNETANEWTSRRRKKIYGFPA